MRPRGPCRQLCAALKTRCDREGAATPARFQMATPEQPRWPHPHRVDLMGLGEHRDRHDRPGRDGDYPEDIVGLAMNVAVNPARQANPSNT